MKVYRDIIQGSDAWKLLRKGKPTASSFSEIITAAKGELSKSSDRYINRLIGECICPDFEPWTGNFATERGKELEPEARAAFSAEAGVNIEEVGFCLADDGICGCSPDALIVGPNKEFVSGVEIKCPFPETHVSYVRAGGLPDDYRQQVHGSMAVTGFREWHFWSYLRGARPHHVVVQWDEYTNKVAAALSAFVAQYREAHARVMPLLIYPTLEAAIAPPQSA